MPTPPVRDRILGWAPAVAVALVALAVNLPGADAAGIWRDEVATLLAASRSWPALWRMLQSVDAVHGVYYAAMHLWLDAVAYTPFSLRLSSVLGAAVCAALVTALGVRLLGRWPGVAAGLVFVALPRTLWLATEVRSYVWATAALTAAVLAFVRALDSGRRRDWLLTAALSALAGWLFVFDVFALVALPVGALVARRRAFPPVALGVGLATLVPLAVRASAQAGQVDWITAPTAATVADAPADVVLLGSSTPPMVWGGWVLLLAAIAGTLASARWGRAASGRPERDPRARAGVALVLLAWALLPAVGMLVWSVVRTPVYYPRYPAPSTPALALGLAAALAVLRPRVVRAGAALALALGLGVVAVPSWQAIRAPAYKEPTALAAAVARAESPADAVVFTSAPGGYSSRVAAYAYPASFAGMRDLTLGTPYGQSAGLWETEVTLDQVPQRLDGVRRVLVVVAMASTSAALQRDEQVLTAQRFKRVRTDSASYWRVEVWDR